MRVFLSIEASKPCGAYYRVALKGHVPFSLVALVTAIARLF